MKLKHLSLGAFSLVALTLSPLAQAETPAPAAPAGEKVSREEKMKQELGLSDDQAAKLKPILEAQKAEITPIKENTALSKEDKKAQMKAVREKYDPQIAAILTPEQQEKMKSAKEARHSGTAEKPKS